jgi:TPR repeat protein
MSRWTAILLGLVLAVASAPSFADSNRVALVIGNAAYRFSPLKNPTNDAKAMAQALRAQGFDVVERENATKAEMEKAIVEFGRKLKADGTGVVYYSGHGIQVGGKNYLIPLDATLTDQREVPLLAVDADNILIQMQDVRSKVNIVILDACRDNPFEQSFRSLSGGLAQMNAPSGTLIAYATAPGKTASDGSGENGLYTQELLKAINEPGLKVEDVFKRVRLAVSKASGDAQIPWESSSLTGDFYFQAPTRSAATGAATPSVELDFWDSVKGSSDPADFNAYLKKYPNGDFADLARNRIAALQSAAKPAQTQVAAVPASKTLAPDPSNDPSAKDDASGAATQDVARILPLVRKAAERGNAGAQTRLGSFYQNGQGVAQDYAQALTWYRRAADQGFPRAEAQIGLLYQKGWGVAQDYGQALSWYRKAADQNDPAAQMRLGELYLKGTGVTANKAEARRWFDLAAKQGVEQAKKILAKLGSE